MDKLTALNLSFDKVLIQILIPGLISIFPWFLIYLHFHEMARSYFYTNQSTTITAISLLALIAGMFLENLSGRFEYYYLDKKLERDSSLDFAKTWNRFLELRYDNNEPIGQRYLRNILLRMKFEISAGIALLPMSLGLLILNSYKPIFDNCLLEYIFLLTLPLTISLYLLFLEAFSSAKILAKTRKLLVDKYHRNSLSDELHST